MRVFNKIWDWLVCILHRRMYLKYDGILMVYVIYKPHILKPNVVIHVHPLLKEDEKLQELYQQVADRIREVYPVNERE